MMTTGLLLLAASVSMSSVELPTYPFSDPDPVPCASEKRYPYFRYDGSSFVATNRRWRTVEMENGRVSVTILPDAGGKVWGATDCRSGFDFIYRNHAAKFRNVAMRGPWWSGGIEYNFGIIGHGPYTSSPVDFCVRTNIDGSASCFVAMTEFICRTAYQVEVRITSGEDCFTTRTTWYNASALPAPYYHWMNSAVSVADDLVLKFDGRCEIGHEGDAHLWPVDGEGRRLSRYTANNFGHNKSYHVVNGDNRVFGAWYPSRGIGFIHENEGCDKYGRKAWLWALSREGAIWEDLLTDSDGQYVEMQSGRAFNQPRFGTYKTPFKHPTFGPCRTDEFVERWGIARAESDYRIQGKNPPGRAEPRPVMAPEGFDWNGAYGHFLRGQQAVREREDVLGERELRASLGVDPHFVPALDELAFLAIRRGRYAEARALTRHSLSVDTYGAAANYASGISAWFMGDAATAKERLGLASYSSEYRNAAYAMLARIALAEGDFARALSMSERVLAADRANRDAMLSRIVVLRKSGRPDAARRAAEEAIAAWPLFHAAKRELALVGGRRDWRDGLCGEMQEEALLEIATWYRTSGLEGDAREFEKAAGEYPLAKIRLGELESAASLPLPLIFPFRHEDIAPLDRAIAEHPSWKFRYYRAVLAASLGDDETADRLLDAIGDASGEWSFYLFRSSRQSGERHLADIRKAASFSDNWRIGKALAECYAERGEWQESADAAARFLVASPGNNQLQIAYARALNGCGRWRETVEFLKNVNILPSEFGDNACDLWQEAWRQLGDWAMARTYPENLGKGAPYRGDRK